MAKKAKTVFMCNECGNESSKWMGQCPVCGAWNSFVEQRVLDAPENDVRRRGSGRGNAAAPKPTAVPGVSAAAAERMDTGIGELNRVLGGGLVKGSLCLISGEPGIGKSTIIIQAAAKISQLYGPVLYVSGEESEEQIKLRADRVCTGDLSNLYLLSETNMEAITAAEEAMKPAFLIIDSIQTMYSDDVDAAPGSPSQIRTCGNIIMNIGKGQNVPVFIVAHVTKSGDLAGPKLVEHMVDAVLQFNGERGQDLRILRAVKNRFGTTSEIGAFEMREEGLVEIENVSGIFLEGLEDSGEGALATAVYEGTRPLLLEIQALTATCNAGFARRTSIGIDNQRLGMIVAVLEKKCRLTMINRDVYVNVVGGLRPEGTSTDLAVALAIWSDEKGVKVPADCLCIGEIGLTGDLRPVQYAEKLVKEASRMGFKTVIMPKRSLEKVLHKPDGIKLIGVTTVLDAIIEISQIAHN